MVRAKFQHPAMPELRMATEYSSPAAFPQIRVPDRSPEPFPDFFKQSLGALCSQRPGTVNNF